MPRTAIDTSTFVVRGKKQETNTGRNAKRPAHYRCTITCAFCGKCKHYEDECYHKKHLSAKLKSEAKNGGQGGKGNGDKGKEKSKGRGKGQEQGKGGGRRVLDKKNQDKNHDKSGGNPNPTPWGTDREPFGGQQNPGPTTRSQMQGNKNKEPSVSARMGTR